MKYASLCYLALCHSRIGYYRKAISYASQAISHANRSSLDENQSTIHMIRGQAYCFLDEYECGYFISLTYVLIIHINKFVRIHCPDHRLLILIAR